MSKPQVRDLDTESKKTKPNTSQTKQPNPKRKYQAEVILEPLHPQKPTFSRSRLYKKNDNEHVEHKNWTHAGQLFAIDRLDHAELAPLMNKVYSTFWCPLQNHCSPARNSKKQLEGATLAFREYHAKLNPYVLKAIIKQQLKLIFLTSRLPQMQGNDFDTSVTFKLSQLDTHRCS